MNEPEIVTKVYNVHGSRQDIEELLVTMAPISWELMNKTGVQVLSVTSLARHEKEVLQALTERFGDGRVSLR